MQVKPVLLCGGSGSRLWPLSTPALPKPFIRLASRHSLFQRTLLRCQSSLFHRKPIVVGHEENEATIRGQLTECGMQADLILEPDRRNSCAAVAMACLHALEKAGSGTPETLLIQACDHWIEPADEFVHTIETALPCAAHRLITFGIRPDGAETGYGYILPGVPVEEAENTGCHEAVSFTEKPDQQRCKELIEQGGLWNSGIFLLDPALFIKELSDLRPDLLESVKEAFYGSRSDSKTRRFEARDYKWIEAISVDCAVLEHSRRTAVMPVNYRWQDLGSWEAITKLFSNSELIGLRSNGNITNGTAVKTGFAESVCDGEDRPWGRFERLDRGDGYQVKRIQVEPGQVLSLQAHHQRSEHWVIVSGQAQITLGDCVTEAKSDDAIHIPRGEVHRIANPWCKPLVLIEVQLGDYLGEDDIVRLDDIYDRKEHALKK